MEKIAVIGPSGAGKSTLAQKLGPRLRLKVYHLDRYFWQPSWRRESRETRRELLQSFVQKRRWVIEGTYLNSSDLHLNEADTIIFLDISPFVCLWRRVKRHHEYQGRPRRDIPKGSTDKLTFLIRLQVLFFPLRARRKLKNKLRKFPPEKIIRLRSTKEVARFLAQLEVNTNEKRHFSYSVVKKKDLTLAKR